MKAHSLNHFYAVVLAGGSGTRFWPLSRKYKPKQFLDVTGKGTLLQETLERIKPKIPGRNVYIVTNKAYKKEIVAQTKKYQVPTANIMLEPEGRNTAPAICWAAVKIHRRDPQAVMAVLPSDHLIANQKKFLSILQVAFGHAQSGYMVTLGIVPTRPETGYGYLATGHLKKSVGRTPPLLRVKKFIEKPSDVKARQFIKQKSYLWNSGMFIWQSTTFLEECRQSLPKVYGPLSQGCSVAYIQKVWGCIPNISVDYGILEKSKNVVTVPAQDIGWSDLGSWESLWEILKKDKMGNVFKGPVLALNSERTFVWANKKLVAAVGLKDLVVIDTPDAVLVCHREHSQSIKEIVDTLKSSGRSEL